MSPPSSHQIMLSSWDFFFFFLSFSSFGRQLLVNPLLPVVLAFRLISVLSSVLSHGLQSRAWSLGIRCGLLGSQLNSKYAPWYYFLLAGVDRQPLCALPNPGPSFYSLLPSCGSLFSIVTSHSLHAHSPAVSQGLEMKSHTEFWDLGCVLLSPFQYPVL